MMAVTLYTGESMTGPKQVFDADVQDLTEIFGNGIGSCIIARGAVVDAYQFPNFKGLSARLDEGEHQGTHRFPNGKWIGSIKISRKATPTPPIPTPPTPAAGPKWGDLIEMDRKDRQGKIRIIDFITSHRDSKVDDFAQLLLDDRVAVQGLHNDNRNKNDFVRAVLQSWVSNDGGPAVPCTWDSLVGVMRRANLDGVTVRDIQNNVCC